MISFSPFQNISGGFIGRDLSLLSEKGYSTENFIRLKQIHSDRILWLKDQKEISKVHLAKGDAIISTLENIPIAIRAADCVPILLAHPSGVVAAIHAGWRGTRSKIVQKVLSEILSKLKISMKEIKIAIGPSICGNCYEVGEEVATDFKNDDRLCVMSDERKFFLNLKQANKLQAVECGILSDQIEVRKECTLCDEKNFYSYRGALKKGGNNEERNYGWIVLRNSSHHNFRNS